MLVHNSNISISSLGERQSKSIRLLRWKEHEEHEHSIYGNIANKMQAVIRPFRICHIVYMNNCVTPQRLQTATKYKMRRR